MKDDGLPNDAPFSERAGAWMSEIERAQNGSAESQYNDRCRVIRKRYRYEDSSSVRTRKYQLLWSNIETLKNAVYAKPPLPTVSRRYRDADPVARVAAEILERAVSFTFDSADFDSSFKQVRDDYLIYGRGCARVYYEPDFGEEKDIDSDAEQVLHEGAVRQSSYQDKGAGERGFSKSSDDGEKDGESQKGDGESQEVKFERVRIRFVQRKDFVHQPSRIWSEVQWVAFRGFLTRKEVKRRFGEKIGKEINLDSASPVDDDQGGRGHGRSGTDAKATVWEIWDKASNKVLWVAKGWPDVLEEGPPYLELDGFFPCPQPAYGTLTPDSLVPVPDYIFYQDQCEEIDQLTARIGALSDALKLVGFYPAGPQGEGSPEVEKAFAPGFENRMIAVQSWSAFKEGGGGGAPVIFLPVEQVLTILEGCVKLRQQLVEDVYQIIGLSDIMRGASDPRETEGAQQLKAQFGGNRVRNRQQEISRFCRDVGRLCGQIIATYCQPSTIAKMTNITLPTQQQVEMGRMQASQQAQIAMMNGQPPPPPPQAPGPTQEDVFGLLRDQLTRKFKIDIENDSTIAGDESKEREDRQGFIVAVTNFMEAWGPMIMQKPDLSGLAGQLLLFGIRAFRVGRELEETIEETVEKLKSMPPPDKGPDPRVQAETVKLQATQMKAQAEVQKSQVDAQSEMQNAQLKLEQAKTQSEFKVAELRLKLLQAEQEHQHKIQEHQHKMAETSLKHEVSTAAIQQKAASQPLPKWPTDQKGF